MIQIKVPASISYPDSTIQTPMSVTPKVIKGVEVDVTVTLNIDDTTITQLQEILLPSSSVSTHLTAAGLNSQYTITELLAALTLAETK